jgi:hypothetical protein
MKSRTLAVLSKITIFSIFQREILFCRRAFLRTISFIQRQAQEWEVLSELAHQFIHGSIGINGHALLFKARNSDNHSEMNMSALNRGYDICQ